MNFVRRAAVTMGLIVAAVACAVPAQAANPPQPSAADQPARDGCQRSNFGIGFDTSPEWVYVYRSPAIRKATGVVRVAHASLQDAILEHRSFDFNANLVPDPQYRFLIAGSRTLHTSNYAPGGGGGAGTAAFRVGKRDFACVRVADGRRPRDGLGLMDMGLRSLAVRGEQHLERHHRRAL
ncbi:MAG: hypothetical protein ACR2JH_09060 [Solirubrobacteraceae bacterium]